MCLVCLLGGWGDGLLRLPGGFCSGKAAAPGSPDPRVPELEQGFYKTPDERSLSAGNGPAEACQDVTRVVSCHTVNEQRCR